MLHFISFRFFAGRTSRAFYRTLAIYPLFSAGMLLPSIAMAGRPMATDDAAVVEHGACQLETWLERLRADGEKFTTVWLNPACNPGGETEFAFGTGREHGDEDHTTVTVWQIKHLLMPYDCQQPGFAVSLSDQRDRRIHKPLLGDTSLTVIATFPLVGESLLAHVNLGARHRLGDDVWHTRATWSGALDWGAFERTRLSLETFGISGERANWQVGLLYELLPGRIQLDMSIGSPYGRWSSERVLTFGAVFLSPPFLN